MRFKQFFYSKFYAESESGIRFAKKFTKNTKKAKKTKIFFFFTLNPTKPKYQNKFKYDIRTYKSIELPRKNGLEKNNI
jgi:hypothetical protein